MELHGGYRHKASKDTGIPMEQWLDFSANINPLGIPERIQRVMIQQIEQLIHYPDPDCLALTKALAEKEGVEEERIYCGNGGADVIYRYFTSLNPKKVLIPVPTFVEYEEVLNNQYPDEVITTTYGNEEKRDISDYKREIVHYEMKATDFILTSDILDVMNPSYDCMVVCSPNNPTGKVIEPSLLKQIVQRAKQYNIQLLLDFSFSDFLEERDLQLECYLKEQPHVTILHSFTKMYAIPGIRIGYAVVPDKNRKEQLRKKGSSWNVNHFAQVAALACLQETTFAKETVAYIKKERQWMQQQLKELGYLVIKGEANYILFQKKGDTTLQKRMITHGILIRSCQNYAGLTDDYYRVAVKKEEENKQLLRALKEESVCQQNAL